MRLEQLTFTRFVAAISIVVYHYGEKIFPFNSEAISFIFRRADIGVSYFFILSGFVMIIAYGDNDKLKFDEFIKRRLARIYPIYVIATLALAASLLVSRKPIDYKSLIFNLTMIQSWLPGYPLSFNNPSWSLSVEMFFYLLFPFLFNHLYKRYSLLKLTFPIILFFAGTQVAVHVLTHSSLYTGFPSKSHDLIFYFPLVHLSEFLIGNLAGLLYIKGLKKGNYDLPIISLVILMSILLKFDFGINYHNGMMAFIFVPLIILISSNNGWLTNIFNGKAPVFLGEISYGIYILQEPVYTWIGGTLKYLGINNSTIIFYAGLISLIAFSAISYVYIETPLRKRINKVRMAFDTIREPAQKQRL